MYGPFGRWTWASVDPKFGNVRRVAPFQIWNYVCPQIDRTDRSRAVDRKLAVPPTAMLSLQLTVKSTTHGRFPFPLCAPQPSLPRSPSHITFPFLSTDPTGSSPSLSMDPGGIQTGAPPPPRAASPSSLKPRSPSLLEPALNP